jgi:hypothetical protein
MGASKRRSHNPHYGQPIYTLTIRGDRPPDEWDDIAFMTEAGLSPGQRERRAQAIAVILFSYLQQPMRQDTFNRVAEVLGDDGALAVSEIAEKLPHRFDAVLRSPSGDKLGEFVSHADMMLPELLDKIQPEVAMLEAV